MRKTANEERASYPSSVNEFQRNPIWKGFINHFKY